MKQLFKKLISAFLITTCSISLSFAEGGSAWDNGGMGGMGGIGGNGNGGWGGNNNLAEQQRLYQEYLDAFKIRQNKFKSEMASKYIYNNGRLQKLPNGRFLAKELDIDYVNQEVACTFQDFTFNKKTSCYACDTGYMNTLTGAYGGSNYYNNATSCAVLKGNNGTSSGGGGSNGGGLAIGGAVVGIGLGAYKEMSNGGVGSGGSGGAGGSMPGGNLATEAFACLEYYTNSNGMTTGGEHLKFSIEPTKQIMCKRPMEYYYNNLYSYYCTQAGCYYESNTTKMLRKMWLYTNPYIFVGQTMVQSDMIANNRGSIATYGSYPQRYIYPM